jgi:hypothetical protein
MWIDSRAVWNADANVDEDEDDCDDWDKFDWDACEVNRIWLLMYNDRDDSKSAHWLINAYDDEL